MVQEKIKREAIALTKNKSYKTYQFHGILGRGKNCDMVFQSSIIQVFNWMRDKFRNFEEIPKPLLLPADGKLLKAAIFKSFVEENGYIIEVLYLQEENSWSFRLTEPDMGSSDRSAAPGRLFITNIAFKITGEEVEFGCQIICKQPESIEADAEVFRPKLVRDLLDQLSLYNICDLKYQAYDLTKGFDKRVFHELLDEHTRQMPILVIERKPDEKIIDIEKIIGSISPSAQTEDFLVRCMPKFEINSSEIIKGQFKSVNNKDDEADKLAKKLVGFAYVFKNYEGNKSRCSIYYPELECIETDIENATKSIMNYPKRNEEFTYGNVLFYPDAQQLKRNMDLKKLKESEDYIKENGILQETISGMKRQIFDIKQRTSEISSENRKDKLKKDDEQFKIIIERNNLLDKTLSQEKELIDLKLKLVDLTKKLKDYEAKSKRPEGNSQFLKWVDEHFIDDIIVLPRAKDLIKKAKNLEIDMICDAMEVLAYGYKAWRLGELSEEAYKNNCKGRCDTPFEITPCGDQTIKRYAERYKVYYNTSSKDKRDRRTLDTHLKFGVDNRYLIRVYFFWDEDSKKIVIGSMPDHLPTVTGF